MERGQTCMCRDFLLEPDVLVRSLPPLLVSLTTGVVQGPSKRLPGEGASVLAAFD